MRRLEFQDLFMQTSKAISDDRTHGLAFLYSLLVFIVFAVIGIWLLQASLNAYYEQTYHRDSPLKPLDQFKLWRQGEVLGRIFYQTRDQLAQDVDMNNQQAIAYFNQHYAYTSEYNAKRAEEAALETKQQQHLLVEQAVADEHAYLAQQFYLKPQDQVFFAGDSMMQGVAPHVQKALLERFNIKTINLSKQSTGLAYPKLFDWPKTIKDTIVSNPHIKVLVVFLGPNDPWDMPNPKGGAYLKYESVEWENVYRDRIASIIQTANQHDVRVIWITPPNMKKSSLNKQMIYLTHVVADEVQKHQALSIDSREILGSMDNVYSDYFQDNGKAIKVRSADGIHFSSDGQKRIANALLHYLKVL